MAVHLTKILLCVEEAYDRGYATFFLHILTPGRFERGEEPRLYGPFGNFRDVETVIDQMFPGGGYFWSTHDKFIEFVRIHLVGRGQDTW